MGIFSNNIFDLKKYVQNIILSIGNQYNNINRIVYILILLFTMSSKSGVYVARTACTPLDWPRRKCSAATFGCCPLY